MKKNYLSLLLFLYFLPGALLADCVSSISFDTDVAGSWEPGCTSEHRSGQYAKYYTFTLSSRQKVTIDLQSSTDTFLLLLNGSDRTGTPIAGNNNRDETTSNSQIIYTISAGTYTIEATTLRPERTGDFVVSVSTSRPSCSDCPFLINVGLNDAWYNPATNGQGIFITVLPDSKRIILAWFTYDIERPPEDVTALLGEPGHRWLTAQGSYDEVTANLTIYVTEGGVFDAAEPTASTDQAGDGTMTIEFADCTEGLVNYEITSLDISGQFPIQRVSPENVLLCELLVEQTQQ